MVGVHGVPGDSGVVVLFPGQGSQARDMRDRVRRWCPELGEAAQRALGADPFSQVRESTAFAQPAIFCASVAGWRAIKQVLEPAAVAGHSLGEFAALVAAGSISPLDALQLVLRRGRLMEEAEQSHGGGMIAVSGPSLERVQAIAERCGVVIANDNSPSQLVLSGSATSIERAFEESRAAGLRAAHLPVCGAFHSPLMADVGEQLQAALAEVEIGPPALPALCTTTCAPFIDVATELTLGITRPVLWRQSVEHLHGVGYRRFVEAGPGTALGKLARRTLGDCAEVLTLDAGVYGDGVSAVALSEKAPGGREGGARDV
jgi:[acyl-carrier-protein] S-malonyltransferase